jgi:hypothetical protein
MGRLLARFMKRAKKARDNMDKYHEAVAFAEAGHPEYAQQLFEAEVAEKAAERSARLLVIGREATFSKEVIEYALEMAQRLSYDILALNTAALSGDAFRLFSSSHKKLAEDFRALSEENVQLFEQEAEKAGVSFDHIVKFGERDEAIEEINREFGNIEFVVSDSEEERPVERAGEGERARQAIYVYSMTSM